MAWCIGEILGIFIVTNFLQCWSLVKTRRQYLGDHDTEILMITQVPWSQLNSMVSLLPDQVAMSVNVQAQLCQISGLQLFIKIIFTIAGKMYWWWRWLCCPRVYIAELKFEYCITTSRKAWIYDSLRNKDNE